FLVNTGRQASRLPASDLTKLVCSPDSSPKDPPMNLGFAKETANGTTELDPMAEFREGIELLKNEYPQKALVRLRRAFECDKHNPYYLSFLGLSIARAQRNWEQAGELCEIAVQLRPTEIQFHLNLGEVYALAGRREKALDKFDDALELFGEDARLRQARSNG